MLSMVVAPWGRDPVVLRNADVPHDAASMMKVAVLAALCRSGVDLDAQIPVVNEFRSVAGGSYGNSPAWDSDPLPWERVGGCASVRWLAGRMVTHSSNLATNLCLAQVGHEAVARVWRRAGATAGGSPRGIEDYAGRDAGVHNRVSARDLVRLLESLEPEVLALLEHNAHRVDIAAGLPPGTPLAGKNGWFPGMRHSAAVIRPADAAPYVLAVCYTGRLANGHAADDPAARLLARVSAGVWRHRHALTGRGA
ncbi:serine hydrolase [Streptomyces telluris]|uniref:Class A beta-lactamase-related serine hydrolase n=1 Tax=Streptomyces telluris TaxID=2720021 RepID=A0A9X2LHA7_9ACTN|nr:serine hydrolase [Streptomyces telluris]MCQ8771153.1 class A beta-lactamase-related serine hydrolase [Streptomyces telluris]NJP82540.1 serine hydrolase [Streptomyces telluris]